MHTSDLGRICVEQVVHSRGQDQPEIEHVRRFQVEQRTGPSADGRVDLIILIRLAETVVVMQPGQESPRPPRVVRHQREAEFRLDLFELIFSHCIDDFRINRLEIEFGVVPVAGERQHSPADAAAEQIQGIGRHEIEPLRVGFESVGEEIDAHYVVPYVDALAGQEIAISKGD